MMIRRFLLTALAMLIASPALAADRDADGVDDSVDNCLYVANPDQRDTNADGFGNLCDGDLDGDGFVTTTDFIEFAGVFQREDADADFDGDGFVSTSDFLRFLDLFELPVGPGALVLDPQPMTCNEFYCTIQVVPGIDLEAAQEDVEELWLGQYAVNGDVQIYTSDGSVILPDASLFIDPNTPRLRGTTRMPDHRVGRFATDDVQTADEQVNVELVQGADLELDVPIHADVWYVRFYSEGPLQAEQDVLLGDLEFAFGDLHWEMILDPVDPFIYTGSLEAIPVPTVDAFSKRGLGVDVTTVGQGYGASHGGRIPFAPSVPQAIQEVLPEVSGDSVFYGRFDALTFVPVPLLALEIEGVVITDEDPTNHAGDRIRVIDGSIDPNVVLPILPSLSLDLDFAGNAEPLPITVITSKTGTGTPNERHEAWLSLDLPDLTPVEAQASGWLSMPGERAASVLYFGPEPEDNFLRIASETAVEIDAARMASIHGVAASELLISQSVLELNAQHIEFTAERFVESIHPDVTYTASSSVRLRLPTHRDSAFDLLIENEAELGGVALREYGKHLTAESYRHWGRYQTPNWGYALEGSFTPEGAWMEGSTNARLPYRYAAVDRIVDVAGRIAATEQAEALAEADYQAKRRALQEARGRLQSESAALEDERAALRTAQDWLADREEALDDARDRNCGSCRWYDAPCLARVATCNTWKAAVVPTLEGAVAVAQAGVGLAQGGLARVQAGYDEAALLVAGAERAADLALDARNEARAALVALRAERHALPLEDGVVDARVALRLTRDGLSGTVSGTFQGADFGEGWVENDDAGSRACFVVPQTGERLCTAL
ncbi:MAG: GC-type dockerin domain-anchored protein [Myxococcota bacterium]